ncbi:MAG: hypothetical protein M1834_001870 [Cirrosporium novae-zelandiae]|nr:MAG: hypothetical protein M1834_001870 [Cirrosporium novae-zelandiae]
MDTVSTLSAAGTLGVAAVGLAFGRPTTTVPLSTLNEQTTDYADDRLEGLVNTIQNPFNRTVRPPNRISRANTSSSILWRRSQATSGGANDTQDWRKRGSISALEGLKDSSVSGQGDSRTSSLRSHSQTPDLQTRRSSWLRRLSTISSSHNQSASSNSRPPSASISFFSHGSTAPIMPHAVTNIQHSSPNKLVKRSSSQRRDTTCSSPRSQVPTFRRPATSHQRSATLQELFREDAACCDSDSVSRQRQHPPNNPLALHPTLPKTTFSWSPFFAKVKKGPFRRRYTSTTIHRNYPIRRIAPTMDGPPTLLMSTSIMSNDSQDDASSMFNLVPQGDDGENRRRRPSTAIPPDQHSPITEHAQTQPPPTLDISHELNQNQPDEEKTVSPVSPLSAKAHRVEKLHRRSRIEFFSTKRIVSAPSPRHTNEQNGRRSMDEMVPRPRRIASSDGLNPRYSLSRLTTETASSTSHRRPSSPLPPLQRLSAFEIEFPAVASRSSDGSPDTRPYDRSSISSPPSSSSPKVSSSKIKRNSIVPSDRASTLIGSDNDTRGFTSGEDDELDFRSETVFDSLPTRATSSSNSGARGPRIETIFDESPPSEMGEKKLIALQDLISHDPFTTSRDISRTVLTEFDDNNATPVPNIKGSWNEDSPSTVRHHRSHREGDVPPKFALEETNDLFLGLEIADDRLEEHEQNRDGLKSKIEDDEDEDWDLDNETSNATHLGNRNLRDMFRKISNQHSRPTTELHYSSSKASKKPKDLKSNIFDWSESQNDKHNGQGISSRPKTSYGKQLLDSRGSRAPARRAPNALHLRSQSVPVLQKPPSGDAHPTNIKFGTWGLGNRGATEDWNDDFEFDESSEKSIGNDTSDATNSEFGVIVPQSIIDRQASVHGQFGQVQELTRLVEELKRLRVQANSLGIVPGSSSALWKEAEGIVNLATLDEDLIPAPRSSSPQSFNSDAFEEETFSIRSRRKSVLSDNSPFHGSHCSPESKVSPRVSTIHGHNTTPPPNRPRKESIAQAMSVLEIINKQRSPRDSTHKDGHKKMPFDTTSLQHLVARAGTVTRELKELVRQSENPQVPSIPSPSLADSPLCRIFDPSPDESPLNKPRLPKSKSANAYLSHGATLGGGENDLTAPSMNVMTVV